MGNTGIRNQKLLGYKMDIKPGINNTIGDEKYISYYPANNELVLADHQGCAIVLGKDMPREHDTGAGGRGEKKCSTIDIVVGRAPYSQGADENGEPLFCYKDLKSDAARIYISQKTNVDENFNIPDGNVGESRDRSAIAMKADAIRIIGREGVKIVTKTEINNSQPRAGSTFDSPKMGTIQTIPGIDLIAGANDPLVSADLQPIPKGNNLSRMLEEILSTIDSVVSNQQYVSEKLESLFKEFKGHSHFMTPMNAGPFVTVPNFTSAPNNTPPPNPAAEVYVQSLNLTVDNRISYRTRKKKMADIRTEVFNIRNNYLTLRNSGDYILSKYNRSN